MLKFFTINLRQLNSLRIHTISIVSKGNLQNTWDCAVFEYWHSSIVYDTLTITT